MNLDFANLIGLIGSAVLVVAFAYSKLSKAMNLFLFNLLNLAGAMALIVSLRVHFNVASMTLEIVWAAIALFGMVEGAHDASAGMIIAVDGPAASGKGTIAKALAAHYGLPHLDTGLLYRAVGIAVLEAGGDPASAEDALHAADHLSSALDDPGLKSEAAGKAASLVSAHPSVHAALLDRQKRFANQAGGAVLDGRDIGTVIAPHADAKLFVTASAEVRAERRYAELKRMSLDVHLDAVLHDIRARDERDSARSAAPLRRADDAALLDTSELGIDAAISAAIALVEQRPFSAAND